MKSGTNDYLQFREKVYRASVEELEVALGDAKDVVKKVTYNAGKRVARLEHIKMLLMVYKIKSRDVNFKLFEDIYQKLILKEKDDQDPSFPLKLKSEFIMLFFKLFLDHGCYSRCETLLDAQKELYERNPDDEHVAFYYNCTYMSVTLEYMGTKTSSPEKYFKRYGKNVHGYASSSLDISLLLSNLYPIFR